MKTIHARKQGASTRRTSAARLNAHAKTLDTYKNKQTSEERQTNLVIAVSMVLPKVQCASLKSEDTLDYFHFNNWEFFGQRDPVIRTSTKRRGAIVFRNRRRNFPLIITRVAV